VRDPAPTTLHRATIGWNRRPWRARIQASEVRIDVTLPRLLAVVVMALTLAIKGPTVYDRILAVNSFGTLTVLLPIIKFIIPFLFLLPRGVKRGSGLMYMCIWILLATIYEIYWWVAPAPSAHEHHFLPSLPWMELAVILGFFGGFVLVVGKSLAKHNLIPIKDPRLHEALHHHQ